MACLIMAMLHKLAPEFVKDGRLCWLRAPLYRVSNGKKSIYCYNDEELKQAGKGEIIRYKGLGQLSAEDTKNSMFSEQFQRLEKIVYSEEGANLLEQLMGENVEPRKKFVVENIDFENVEV